jgi:hypothetical protein
MTVETDLFEHREVKPHFINPCCFGEDFAAWLLLEIVRLTDDGFEFSSPIQEDYGWGFSAQRGKDRLWVALSYVGDGPTQEPARFVVSVTAAKKLFRSPDARAFAMLRDRLWQSIEANEAIRILD